MHAKNHKPLKSGRVRKIAADLNIHIRCGDKSFSLNCVLLPNGKFAVKRGHDLSEKIPFASLTQIFAESRKWAVRNL
jgi:hypothetical protein